MASGQGTLSGHISSSSSSSSSRSSCCWNLLHHPPPETHQSKPTWQIQPPSLKQHEHHPASSSTPSIPRICVQHGPYPASSHYMTSRATWSSSCILSITVIIDIQGNTQILSICKHHEHHPGSLSTHSIPGICDQHGHYPASSHYVTSRATWSSSCIKVYT